MNKQLIYAICTILLLTITVAGSTSAFYSASAGNNTTLKTNGTKLEVLYTGGDTIDGSLNAGTNKESGLNTTVNIRVSENSVEALADLYINIEKITSNIATEGFIWEVYGYSNSNQVYYNSGNFKNKNATTDNIINIVNDYKITKTNTTFTVYFWVDGNKTGNEILGGEFKGYISASTESFTGELE